MEGKSSGSGNSSDESLDQQAEESTCAAAQARTSNCHGPLGSGDVVGLFEKGGFLWFYRPIPGGESEKCGILGFIWPTPGGATPNCHQGTGQGDPVRTEEPETIGQGYSIMAIRPCDGAAILVRRSRHLPPWPHPTEDDPEVIAGRSLGPSSLRYLFQCEGERVAAYLTLEDGPLRDLRLVAAGFRITISGVWFQRLSRERQLELLQGTDSSHTSSPWSSDIASDGVSSGSLNSAQVPFPSSSGSSVGPRAAMLTTDGEEAGRSIQRTLDSEVPTVKSALARGSESRDGMGEEWAEQYQVREAEAVIPSLESWEDVREELAGLHQRLALLVCQSGRDVSSSAERGSIDPAQICLLQDLSTQNNELEWRLQKSDLEKLEENCQVARALALRAAHLEAQPLTHARLISNQEVNEHLKDWKEAMAAEFQSLISKGAIQVVSDQQVREC